MEETNMKSSEEPPQRDGLIERPVQGDLMKGPAEEGSMEAAGQGGVNGGGRAGGSMEAIEQGRSMKAAGQGGQWRWQGREVNGGDRTGGVDGGDRAGGQWRWQGRGGQYIDELLRQWSK